MLSDHSDTESVMASVIDMANAACPGTQLLTPIGTNPLSCIRKEDMLDLCQSFPDPCDSIEEGPV